MYAVFWIFDICDIKYSKYLDRARATLDDFFSNLSNMFEEIEGKRKFAKFTGSFHPSNKSSFLWYSQCTLARNVNDEWGSARRVLSRLYCIQEHDPDIKCAL